MSDSNTPEDCVFPQVPCPVCDLIWISSVSCYGMCPKCVAAGFLKSDYDKWRETNENER